MKQIPLTQGKFTVVDDVDYGWLSQFGWYAAQNRNTFYAVRSPNIKMHRELLGLNSGDEGQCDHIDGNGLNNQRVNLRICTIRQNQFNQKAKRGFKGVSWHKRQEQWQARIGFNHKDVSLGFFNTPIEAAKAYDEAAIEYYGGFARLNFPERSES